MRRRRSRGRPSRRDGPRETPGGEFRQGLAPPGRRGPALPAALAIARDPVAGRRRPVRRRLRLHAAVARASELASLEGPPARRRIPRPRPGLGLGQRERGLRVGRTPAGAARRGRRRIRARPGWSAVRRARRRERAGPGDQREGRDDKRLEAEGPAGRGRDISRAVPRSRPTPEAPGSRARSSGDSRRARQAAFPTASP
ncbi:MAG: hypothetical protein DIJKHBIC_00371 [Thermoanaerobaculia bacterium]|nr:hypothetical protein [Thermoanaerobaculia bacterium]